MSTKKKTVLLVLLVLLALALLASGCQEWRTTCAWGSHTKYIYAAGCSQCKPPWEFVNCECIDGCEE